MTEKSSSNGAANGAAASKKMEAVLAAQRKAQLAEGAPSAETRIDRINRSIALLVDHKDEIVEALSSDFGHRNAEQSLLTDIMGTLGALKHARTHLRSWMRPERRPVQFPLNLAGARGRIEYQPKGVVGVISPWNFPVNLTFAPMAGIFAAGNRVMIKPSEYTQATSELMARMIAKSYDETEVAIFPGGPDVGQEFTRLAFDHLIFTGGTSIAYHVMRAASENLVPVTLELGGKSPVILSESADFEEAAAKIMNGKMLNAGQICLAPDYVLLPKERMGEFVEQASSSVGKMYPSLKENPEYTSIINQRHFDRLNELVADARAKGGKVVEINPADEDFSQQPHHKIPPTLILDPGDDTKVMQEEIFGPVLPLKGYGDVEEAVDYVNAHDRPLGLYYFGNDRKEQAQVLGRTTSGGVTVNDVIMHVSMEDLPFGGIGPSGMGAYHGREGFLEFSHAKSVYTQTRVKALANFFRAPFGPKRGMIDKQIRK